MKSFELDGKRYQYIEFKNLDPDSLPAPKRYKKSSYYDIGSGFDIESTNFKKNQKWYATMYIWQWSFNEMTVIGRSWGEFKEMVEILKKRYSNPKIKLLVYIHNLSFEWSFCRKYIPVTKLLAKTVREVLFFDSDNIEFRDSACLTRLSLAQMAKKYKLGIEKLKGDLDYNPIRISCSNYATPLTDQELAYCINDVQILQKFFHKIIKQEYLRNGYKIPLTQTGVPRMETKRALKKEGYQFTGPYRDMIQRCMPEQQVYIDERTYLFRGGYVHGNNEVINDLQIEEDGIKFAGFDRKSSYPAEMLHKKVPMEFYAKDPSWLDGHWNEPEEFWDDWGIIVYCTFKKIQAKYPHSIESKHKIIEYDEFSAIWDNGRLRKCDSVTVMLNEYDLLNYRDFYDFEELEIHWLKVSRKEWLPDFLIKNVYHYFYDKEHAPKGTVFYQRSKEKLNSLFGMCCTGICVDDYILYNGNLILGSSKDLPEEIRKEPKSFEEATKNVFLLPIWGIAITSGARRELLKIVKICPYDSLYCDTDSDKIRNYEQYLPQINEYNAKMEQLNREAAERWGFEFDVIKDMGKWMNEGEFDRFKTLGCKRYLYRTKAIPEKKIEAHTEAVVAGMEKGSFLNWCELNGYDPFEKFEDKLYLAPEFSNKITTGYTDEAFTFKLTDKDGITGRISEESCCALFSIPFTMKMDPDFLALISLLQKKKEREREIYKGVL